MTQIPVKFEPYEEHYDIERFSSKQSGRGTMGATQVEWFGHKNICIVEEPSDTMEAIQVYPCTDYRTADSTFQTKAACYSRAFCLP